MGEVKRFYDTNALLEQYSSLKEIGEFYTSSIVLDELEHIKTASNKDVDLKFKARSVSRYIAENMVRCNCVVVMKKHYDLLETMSLPITNDNLIIACANLLQNEIGEQVIFVTNDICCINIAQKIFGLRVESKIEKKENEYKGFIEVTMSDEEMADMYSDVTTNTWKLLVNEYIIVKDNFGNTVDKLKWNGECLEVIKYAPVQHRLTEKIKPRNVKQELLFDMLQDKESKVKVIQGLHGTGKTLCMIVHALSLIEKGKFDKIIWVVQNQQVSETKDIGALPGGIEDKMMPYTSIFADKVGGQFGLDMLMSERKLEVIPLAYIRGRSFSRAIVMMTECENTTTQHMKLLLSRLEEDSILMIDGDFKQTDKEVFKANNGLNALIEHLKGQSEFALMTLNDVERSKLANLASLLD
jgi:predicted ribonuclease YlaK